MPRDTGYHFPFIFLSIYMHLFQKYKQKSKFLKKIKNQKIACGHPNFNVKASTFSFMNYDCVRYHEQCCGKIAVLRILHSFKLNLASLFVRSLYMHCNLCLGDMVSTQWLTNLDDQSQRLLTEGSIEARSTLISFNIHRS